MRVLSPRGDFTAHAHATDDPAEVGPVDFVFLGLKANSYAACGPLIEPLLHDSTAVVAAQNGIPWWYFHRHGGPHDGHRVESVDPDGAVSAVLAPERAVGCVVYAATELEGPGVVRHLEGTRFSVGEPDRSVSARCTAFSEAMQAGWAEVPGRARPAQRHLAQAARQHLLQPDQRPGPRHHAADVPARRHPQGHRDHDDRDAQRRRGPRLRGRRLHRAPASRAPNGSATTAPPRSRTWSAASRSNSTCCSRPSWSWRRSPASRCPPCAPCTPSRTCSP